MRFSAHSIDEEKYEAKWWLEDDQGTIFRFELPENTVHAWRLAAKQSNFPENSLPDSVSFSNCEFIHGFNDEDHHEDAVLERVAFCKFLLALERENSFSQEKFQSLEIFQKHTQIANLANQWPYCFLFLQTSDDKFLFEEERDEGEWGYSLEQAYQSNPSSELIADLVSHYDLLREFVYQACKQKPEQALLIAKNYAALVKAILRFLDVIEQDISSVPTTDSSVVRRLSRKYTPYFYALLIENEVLNPTERQTYLDFIFSHQVSDEDRDSLLLSILDHLAENTLLKYPDSMASMHDLVSSISRYYLNHYEIDKAVFVWEQIYAHDKKDWLLRIFSHIYKRPWRFVIPLVALAALSFFSGARLLAVLSSSLSLVIFLVFFPMAFYTVLARLFKGQGISYLPLLLPRLFGSIIVGLSILVLQNTVWEITLNMPWGNWLLMTLATYIGYLVFIFWDRSRDNQGNGQQSIQTTLKIFAIGLLEAFGLTTLVSSLIPLNALGEAFQKLTSNNTELFIDWQNISIIFLSNNILVFQLFGPNLVTLAYFPKLIVLWAGLSLLIGAFVQIIWQDRQITAS